MFSTRPAQTTMGAQTSTTYTPNKTCTYQPGASTEEHIMYDDSNDILFGEDDIVAQPRSDKGKAPARSQNSLACDAADQLIVSTRAVSPDGYPYQQSADDVNRKRDLDDPDFTPEKRRRLVLSIDDDLVLDAVTPAGFVKERIEVRVAHRRFDTLKTQKCKDKRLNCIKRISKL